MDVLTRERSASPPGILKSANGGVSDHGGYIDINFDLTAAQEFTFGKGLKSNEVGSVTIQANQTQQGILSLLQ